MRKLAKRLNQRGTGALGLCVAVTLCLALLVFRISLGVDLSDEAYYATFIDGWLKNGVHHNSNLMIHQTAAILIYPLAIVYQNIRGSETGLILFLRFVYVVIASFSAVCLYRVILLNQGKVVASLTAAFAMLFIPFGLPAPSYNTIGMFSMVAALSLFAVSLSSSNPTPQHPARVFIPSSLWLSAICWTTACIAYPTMIVSLIALFIFAQFIKKTRTERQLVHRYILFCSIFLLIGVAALLATLGPEHLWKAVRFSNAAANFTGGLSGKLKKSGDLITTHPRFAWLILLALLIGVGRALAPNNSKMAAIAVIVLILGATTSEQPALWIRTHDLVFLLAISGIGVAFMQLKDRGINCGVRATGAIYFVSLFTGVVTASTAYNGLLNFPVGSFLAACLSVSMMKSSAIKTQCEFPRTLTSNEIPKGGQRANWAVLFLACCSMEATNLTYYYGQNEKISFRESVLINEGIFSGLRTDQNLAFYIIQMTEAIREQRNCGNKISVFGLGPAFYLLTPLTPSTLATFNITENKNKNFATDAEENFFSVKENQPDVIIVNNWQWATPLSTSENNLLRQYVLSKHVSVGMHSALIYIRADCLL